MNRRSFLKTITGIPLALTFTQSFSLTNEKLDRQNSRKAAKRPNLLIIQTDEHNFRTLGCCRKTLPPEQALIWGPKAVVDTPNIDWLAQKGALCTSFYATTPVCSPSRAAFVSGRYPQNTPVVTNNIPLDDNIITFAELLRRQGYATGYSGKWHLDGTGKPQWAPERKFGFTDNRYMFNRGHWKQLEDTPQGPRVEARNNKGGPSYSIEGANEKCFTTDFLADKTVQFIQDNKNQSWCYMVSLPDPHGPNTVRPPYDTMYNHLKFEKPRTANKSDQNLPSWAKKAKRTIPNQALARYFGMVKCIDDNVGKILNALRRHDLIENTIVVFTADHGDLCGEHGRDNKGVPFEASAKIPFLLCYPGKVPAGAIIHEALSCVDFLPTVMSLMTVPTTNREQGRDASILFTSGKSPKNWKDIAFLRSTGNSAQVGWVAAVTKRYKLVVSIKDDPWLFDLDKDPDELINFYKNPAYHDIVRTLAGQLLDYGKKFQDSRIDNPKLQTYLQRAI
ncbi:MAG: sulfatase family protein [Planctomycetota bacterium]|jgi:arylsulfatase A-like enzyme